MNHHNPIPASHLWVCAENGNVYHLRDVRDYIGALSKTYSMPEQPAPNWWERVDTGFRNITAGYNGLVCGLKKSNFYVRVGVSHDAPLGTGWKSTYCDASEITVSKNCAVRKTGSGKLYMANILKSRSDSIFLPDWKPIPPCKLDVTNGNISGDKEVQFQHMILDKNDRLFALTSSGEVFGYYSLIDCHDPSWKHICGPPSSIRGGLGQKFWTWLTGDQKESLFSYVGTGNGCLWCVRENGSGEVWQLVVSELKLSNGILEIRPNWVKFQLPVKADIFHLTADKCTIDGLFIVSRNEEQKTVIYFCSLDRTKEREKLEIALPETCQNCDIKSITICRTQTDIIQHTPPPKRQKTSDIPSLYPSIGSSEGNDICCENNECSHCRKAAVVGPYVRIPRLLVEPEDESIPVVSRAEGSGVGEQRMNPQLRNLKRKNRSSGVGEYEESFGAQPSKKSRVEHSMLELLQGVEVTYEERVVLNKDIENPNDLKLPTNILTEEEVNSQFFYSFEEERKILSDTGQWH